MKETFESITKLRAPRYRELFGDKAVECFDRALCNFLKMAKKSGTSEANPALTAARFVDSVMDRIPRQPLMTELGNDLLEAVGEMAGRAGVEVKPQGCDAVVTGIVMR